MENPDSEKSNANIRDYGDFNLKSRIHPLHLNDSKNQNQSIFIKREDELSSGVMGSKLRKYSSLIPSLKKDNITQVGLIAGPNSNNAIAALQLFKEAKIELFLFIRKAAAEKIEGNALFTQMLCPKGRIFEIERTQWKNAEKIANDWASIQNQNGIKSTAILEGSFDAKSLTGAMTLADDICRNELENDIFFDTIYIDSGTGLSAICLILGLSKQRTQFRTVIITLVAGSESEFLMKLSTAQKWLEEKSNNTHNLDSINLRFIYPPTAKSYGSINQTIINKTISIAKDHGLLMDPIYSTKHFMSMENDLLAIEPKFPSLFIYNGGSLGLSGFQNQLQNTLNTRIQKAL